MGASIFKQPNGLYGRYSYVSDGFTDANMSKEEYIISRLEHAITDAKDTLKKHLGDYNEIISDAEEHVKVWDEYISEAEDEEEKKDLIKEKKEMEEELEFYKNTMNNPPDKEQKNYNSFYKELLILIENLCIDYNIVNGWDYVRKDYVPSDYPNEDLTEFTKKIKEINSLYNTLKEKRVNEQNNKAQE